MNGAGTWYATVNEDGSFSILSRVCSLAGTGETVAAREGPTLVQADVSSITAKIFALGTSKDNQSGTEITPAPTLTMTDNLYDELQTSGWPIEEDAAGYNFRFDVSPIYVPNGGEWYKVEVKVTLIGGGVAWLEGYVKTTRLQTS